MLEITALNDELLWRGERGDSCIVVKLDEAIEDWEEAVIG